MIPVCEPTLTGNEAKYVLNCLKANWISSKGNYIEKFESMFSEYCGAKFGIACNSGTSALHLALLSLGIGKGDEVIIPTFTMIATCNAVIYCGAKPVLVDANKKDWCIDAAKIEEKITEKTKAIVPVHIYGHPCDMGPILKLAKKYGLYVIEDAAEAHGAEYKGKKVGCLGNAGCFSFYGNKIITTGEGGMVVTNDKAIASKARLLVNHAHATHRFLHNHIGFSYRLTNLQAAIGVAQMEHIDELIESRIKNAQLYNKILKGLGITLPPQRKWAKNVYWMYGILIKDDFGVSKENVIKKLKEKGIETRSFFYGMHLQPIYRKQIENFPNTNGKFPVSDHLSKNGMYLPSGSSLTEKQIHYIADSIKSLKAN